MITLKDVCKNYGSFGLHLSMEIPEGSVTGLIGKNGAGKSTVMKLILGLIRPDSGEVLVFDKDACTLGKKEKQQIGTALADGSFSEQLRITDIAAILKEFYPAFEKEAFLKQCKELDLPQKKRIQEFSTGMRAKLRVLIALSHQARLLILDEPTAGLDVEARREILDLLRSYLAEDEKRSLLITSHISSDLETLCDDLYLIDNGGILLHEETDRILDRYGILKADDRQYEALDKSWLLSVKQQPYGYACLTGELDFYRENYPQITAEKCGIDEVLLMMTGKENV